MKIHLSVLHLEWILYIYLIGSWKSRIGHFENIRSLCSEVDLPNVSILYLINYTLSIEITFVNININVIGKSF